MSGIVRIQQIPLALLQIKLFHGLAYFTGWGIVSNFIRNSKHYTCLHSSDFWFSVLKFRFFSHFFSHSGLWISETLTCQQKPHIRLLFLQLPQVDRWKPEAAGALKFFAKSWNSLQLSLAPRFCFTNTEMSP